MGAAAPILRSFLFALAATVVVEAAVAAFLGMRSSREQGVVAAMNAMTNPVLVFLLLVAQRAGANGTLPLAFLECAVVFTEWRVLRWALSDRVRRPLAISFALNSASFGVGLALGMAFRGAL